MFKEFNSHDHTQWHPSTAFIIYLYKKQTNLRKYAHLKKKKKEKENKCISKENIYTHQESYIKFRTILWAQLRTWRSKLHVSQSLVRSLPELSAEMESIRLCLELEISFLLRTPEQKYQAQWCLLLPTSKSENSFIKLTNIIWDTTGS